MGYDRRDMISINVLTVFSSLIDALAALAIVILEAAEAGFVAVHLNGLAGASCHLAVQLGMFGPCLP